MDGAFNVARDEFERTMPVNVRKLINGIKRVVVAEEEIDEPAEKPVVIEAKTAAPKQNLWPETVALPAGAFIPKWELRDDPVFRRQGAFLCKQEKTAINGEFLRCARVTAVKNCEYCAAHYFLNFKRPAEKSMTNRWPTEPGFKV